MSVHAADRGNFTCAVLADGNARCWGYNGYGNLGDGTTSARYAPVAVQGVNNVRDISVGNIHACATKSDGTAWCWGYGGTGTLGQGNTSNSYTAVQVPGISGANSVAAGYRFSCSNTASVGRRADVRYPSLWPIRPVLRAIPASVPEWCHSA